MPRAFVPTALLALALALPGAAPAQRYETDPLAYYRQFPDARIRSLEYDLIWIGGVDAVANGVIGRQSLEAIRAFERRVRRRLQQAPLIIAQLARHLGRSKTAPGSLTTLTPSTTTRKDQGSTSTLRSLDGRGSPQFVNAGSGRRITGGGTRLATGLKPFKQAKPPRRGGLHRLQSC